MKIYKRVLFLALILFVPVLSFADDSAKVEAEKLLQTVKMESILDQTREQMLNIQMQQNPAMLPFKDVMSQFLGKYLSYASLKDDLIKLYTENFTAKELRDINAFYNTDTGKKAIKVMPQLMTKGNSIGIEKVRAHMPELKELIEKKAEELKAQQQNK